MDMIQAGYGDIMGKYSALNESWGVPQIVSNERQRMTSSMLYYMTKAADPGPSAKNGC